ncbi:cupin domain-containing protein [Conexibacter sp. SYSU D00693]|uniref:cupin domain-containing protein n=1 Tax=Conexibacter sp. SYSU D00693 TaxID=2812560 RepID=UPI00196B4642|nr:cupin domain-containing protein [Conexibacter sp. SYSU D00693]
MSAHVVHVADVPAREIDTGELRSRRRRIGPALGTARAQVSLWEVAPGARSTPPHVHADEEELHLVLRGSGLSWQDGATCEVRAGDVLLHRCDAEAHTLVAGDEGLDVLAFAEGSRTSLTWMPRTRMMWAAKRWLPADGRHPFAADAELAPLEVPAPGERFAGVAALADLGAVAGETTRIELVRLEPGATDGPRRCHSVAEVLAVVLEGDGEVVLGDERVPVRRGSLVARPPGTGVAHAFCAGSSGLSLAVWWTTPPGDAVLLADEGELRLPGLGVTLPLP